MTDILLVDPTKVFKGSVGIPHYSLPVLSVAGYLERHGLKVEIFDYKFEDLKEMNILNASCVGITAMSGRQVFFGLEVARYIREKDSGIPIIWGGIHPSILPEQTLKSRYADIVVCGEGELTALELVKNICEGKPIKDVKGISYKKYKKVIHNPPRPLMNMEDISDMPLHLLKSLKKYHPEEVIRYASSRGCPHRCKFCYNSVYAKSMWRTKSISKIVSDVGWIIEKFHPKSIDFIDDNFFVDKNRAEEICREFIKNGFDTRWSGDCRIDYFKRFDDSYMEVLRKSGCDTLFIGIESGCQRILDFISKDIKADEIIPAIEKCKRYGIKPFCAFMLGFPTETKEEAYETLSMIDKIQEVDEEIQCQISIFSPYEGTGLYDISIENGFKPPSSLEEWGDWNFGDVSNLSWCNYKEFLDAVSNIVRVKNKKYVFKRPFISNLVKDAFRFSANMRWKYKFFNFPAEWKVWNLLQKWRGYLA